MEDSQSHNTGWTVALIFLILALLVFGAYATLKERLTHEPVNVFEERTEVVPQQ